jgi:hypothetical protein
MRNLSLAVLAAGSLLVGCSKNQTAAGAPAPSTATVDSTKATVPPADTGMSATKDTMTAKMDTTTAKETVPAPADSMAKPDSAK